MIRIWKMARGITLAAAAVAAVLLPLASLRAPAQSPAGIAGVVRDPSGAVVPKARVTLTQIGAGRKELAVTSATGDFAFPSLPDGDYRIDVATPGFKLLQVSFQKNSAGPARLELTLDVGSVREVITVGATRLTPAPTAQSLPGRTPTRIRVGGNVQATRLIYQPKAYYPEDCKAEGVEGSVLLVAIISKDGGLLNLKQVNQFVDARLVKAATDAVQLWRYEPTRLNGEPVEVITEIDVNFTLQ